MTYNVFGGTLSLTQSINQSINPAALNKVLLLCGQPAKPLCSELHTVILCV